MTSQFESGHDKFEPITSPIHMIASLVYIIHALVYDYWTGACICVE